MSEQRVDNGACGANFDAGSEYTMRTSITVKLPKNEAERASRAMKERGMRRIDRYVRALIREDLSAREIDTLEALILEGERSGPAKPLDEAE